MSAQPVEHYEDPRDPQIILRSLPERERSVFLKDYREAVDAAHDPAGYRILQHKLERWATKVRILDNVLEQNPNYYEDLDASRQAILNGTADTVPVEEAFPDWNEFATRAHTHRYG
ncbi:hypothetical protein GCM10023196_006210 [Actinoallomurus vinaceus]|uniref:Uncharacterized protein n=1 Tax=Actinoallomurus vinaceus TaxID=1080074 RepID=A0ABP8U094_9ACTN